MSTDNPIQELLAEKIRILRTGKGLTQQQAADQAGMLRETIACIEAGNRDVKAHEIPILSKVLGFDLSTLLSPKV